MFPADFIWLARNPREMFIVIIDTPRATDEPTGFIRGVYWQPLAHLTILIYGRGCDSKQSAVETS